MVKTMKEMPVFCEFITQLPEGVSFTGNLSNKVKLCSG